MPVRTTISLGLILLLVLAATQCLYIVSERERAVLLRFGEVVEHDVKPGIHFKLPVVNTVRLFDGRLLTLDALERILAGIGPGLTELGCHPGLVADVASTYARERVTELRILCSPGARDIIGRIGIELVSFHDLARLKTIAPQAST